VSERTSADVRFMARAIRLAERGLFTTDPNPRVGCVIVKDNEIIGEGWHERAGGPHAEVMALQQAGSLAQGATAYVTLEPCCHHGRTPPCSDALINAKLARVVVAMQDPNPFVSGNGLNQLKTAGIDVEHGVLEQQARALNPGFIQRMQHKRPWVRCKIAMSLDGRTAMANGESQWITSTASRADVHRLRARSSAIVTGVGTVLNDNPSLNARPAQFDDSLQQQEIIQPLRVVLDSHLRMPANARMLSLPGKTLVFTCNDHEPATKELQQAGAEVVRVPKESGFVQLQAVMSELARREINDVLLEAGATLNGAMLRAGLIDEFIIYTAPVLMGNEARGLFNLPGLHSMEQRLQLSINDVRQVGPDLKIMARLQNENE
jgi:diaminohydroxyphosphoribosylaminopyrimidine deaminase/5-amino-6-(5-phosphoribosylamino)uracil reductase